MRGRFDHDPTMIRAWSDHELVISHPPVRRGYFSRFGDAFCIENYISRSGYLLRFHRILRLPRKVTLRHHQILRLPRKMILMIDIRDIWNVIYNARSNKHHPPTSPNAAPATKKDAHHWLSSHMKGHLQCAEQQASPSNLTKYCACHAKLHSKIKEKFAENSWSVNSNAGTIRAWSDHDPSMNSSSRTRPFAEVTFRASETHFVLKITTFPAPAIYSNFTEYCACHEKWHSDITKYCACHEKWHSDITNYCACHEKWHSDITKCCACQEKWHSDITKYCACHEMWDCYWTVTELLLNWAVTELLLTCSWTVTELLLNWTVTQLLLDCYWTVTEDCYWTELLLSCYWAVTKLLLSCYWTVTELILDCHWTVTELTCYWAVTELSCYWTVTELLLNWTVTELLLNWPVTELLLNWAVTQLLLDCYWTVTELLLNWPVTELLLNCYWTVTLHCYLNCYCPGLFAFLNLRNSEVSQLHFLWLKCIYIYYILYIHYINTCVYLYCILYVYTYIILIRTGIYIYYIL